MRISEDLESFVESNVSVVVGTRDRDRNPHITRGWGVCVLPDRSGFSLLVPRATSEHTLSDLEDNGRIAVTFVNPITYRSVQLKGASRGVNEPTAEDLERALRHQRAFGDFVRLEGFEPEHFSHSWWSSGFVKITVSAEQAFDQTPGVGAGRRL